MADFFASIPQWLIQGLIVVPAILVIGLISRRLMSNRTRPAADPYGDTEFGENGVPIKPQGNRESKAG